MKKLIISSLFAAMLLVGCGKNRIMTMHGYFYISPNYGNYVVMLSTTYDSDSDGDVVVTKNLSFEEATDVCNKLNKDLSQHENPSSPAK